MSYICFEHVNKFFGENHVLKDISLSVEQGELVTFLGLSLIHISEPTRPY